MQALRALLVLVFGLQLLQVCRGQNQAPVVYQQYDPCTPADANPVNIGDGYVIGIAYWPGGTWEDWNLTRSGDVSDIPRLNPCLGDVFINITVAEGGLANDTQSGITQRTGFVNYRDELIKNNVYFASFLLETDTMAALRTTVLEEQQLSNLASSLLQEPVVSVVAFRGNVTSPPMYIRSNDPSLTTETGIVDQLGLTIALDKGVLSPGGLQWFNFDGCSSCSENQTSCVQYEIPTSYQLYSQQSCAADITCKNCSTTIMATFQGNTVSGQPLQSAYQLSSAYQYSISSAFNDLLAGFDEDL